MTKFNALEELRTKEELVNYFAQRGQSITEEEIESLKKSYEQGEENYGALTLQQLDDVAGGGLDVKVIMIRTKSKPKGTTPSLSIDNNLNFNVTLYSESISSFTSISFNGIPRKIKIKVSDLTELTEKNTSFEFSEDADNVSYTEEEQSERNSIKEIVIEALSKMESAAFVPVPGVDDKADYRIIY